MALGKVSLVGQISFDSPIIPARPGALDGGNPIEGLGRPDDPNPSRVGDYKPHGTKAFDSSDGGEAKTEDSLGRNDASGGNSDLSGNESSEARNESAEARNESAEARNESAEARNESAEARNESSEARNESAEAKSEFDESRKESVEGKHEFAEGRGETKDAYNEGAEARSDTTAGETSSDPSESSHSSHSIRKRTRALVPVLNSPQPGQTVRKGGFTNFAKEQAASQQIHDELYEAEKARIKSAAKKSDGKAYAGGTDKADASKTDKADASKTGTADASKTGKADASKTGKADASKTGTADASKTGKADASKTGKADASKIGADKRVLKPNESGTSVIKANGNASRKLSQADNPSSKSNTSSRHLKQELVPPPPPYKVPLVTQSKDTPERKALELITNNKYATAESKLQDLLKKQPDNCHARYLLGISLVMQRKYDEAKKEYSYVIEHSTDEKLIDLATQGLQKL